MLRHSPNHGTQRLPNDDGVGHLPIYFYITSITMMNNKGLVPNLGLDFQSDAMRLIDRHVI